MLDRRPYLFLQIDSMEHGFADSICNHMEADAVVDLVKHLKDCNDESWCSVGRLRIITFYTAHVWLLRKKLFDAGLNDVLVATVDSSQGCEADVAIVSLVRSSSAVFLNDDRRVKRGSDTCSASACACRQRLSFHGNGGCLYLAMPRSATR